MAVGRLVTMASGRTIRGAGSGVQRELAPETSILQQDHGEVSASSWSPLWRKKAPCMFDVSRFANASLVRCGAASALAISRRNEILEREEETLHSWPNVSEAEADVGRVECCGKGCRPVYEEEASTSSASVTMACPVTNFLRENFPSPAELQIKIQPQFEPQLEQQVSGGWMFLSQSAVTTRSFELAMQDVSCDSQHLSDFAMFSWKSLGDVDKAEELYQEALDHASCDNTEILASYANFLWQCDQ